MKGRSVLVVGAHPDDEVLGAGGVMAKHADIGDEVHVLIVTEGATQQYDDESIVEQKQSETNRCLEHLGVDSVRFGDLPDMKLDDVEHVTVNEVIEDAVDAIRPDIVYTHSNSEVNHDHKEVHESTIVATRPGSGVSRVLAYEVPSSTDWVGGGSSRFSPSVYVDISDQLATKLDAFQEYETEMREYPHPRSTKALRARAQTRGSEAGFDAAEAFCLVKERRSKL